MYRQLLVLNQINFGWEYATLFYNEAINPWNIFLNQCILISDLILKCPMNDIFMLESIAKVKFQQIMVSCQIVMIDFMKGH